MNHADSVSVGGPGVVLGWIRGGHRWISAGGAGSLIRHPGLSLRFDLTPAFGYRPWQHFNVLRGSKWRRSP